MDRLAPERMVTTKIPGQQDILEEMIARYPEPGRVLDIGTGSGKAARSYHGAGWDVTATGYDIDAYMAESDALPAGIRLEPDVDICNMTVFEDGAFDAVWCAHVLEHVLDTGRALAEIRRVLRPNGRLFIAVPPFKHQVVGGHVTPGWNIGILIYVLAVAGFDLKHASFVHHGYNVFADLRRGDGPLPREKLHFSNGDIEALQAEGRLPEGHYFAQGFEGNLPSLNWNWTKPPVELQVPSAPAIGTGRMRLAFFVPWITQGRGGTENVGQMMANAMVARGHAVEVFTFDDKKRPSCWPLDPAIRLTHFSEAETHAGDLQIAAAVGQMSPDLIVGLHLNRTMRRYVRCSHRLGVPLVLSEHIDPRFPARLKTFEPALREVVMSGATRIHLLTDAFRSSLPSCLQDRIRVIPNTVPGARRVANPGGPAEHKILLTVARLIPRKNIARLIAVFARIAPLASGWMLRIVGDGGQMPMLRNFAESSGISERIDFAGHIADPYPHYETAHLFALPSIFEGFPMSSLEAMAHGLPILGYGICNGLNLQVKHGINGLLSSGGQSEGSLGSDLLTLVSDDSLRARMGAASLDRFNGHYGNDTIFRAWEMMFHEAVAAGVRAQRPSRSAYLSAKLDDVIWGESQMITPLV